MAAGKTVHVSSAEPRHAPGLSRLFAGTCSGCHCRYWHFDGTAREWLARCAQQPEENQREMAAALGAGSEQMRGMVAEADGEVVGWLKLAPAGILGKLYGQRLYKGLGCLDRDPQGTFTVACLLVREDVRRQGVARALLAGAIARAPHFGARALEAFPRGDTDCADAALLTGPSALFLEAGFEVIHDFAPYPVLRLHLPPRGGSD